MTHKVVAKIRQKCGSIGQKAGKIPTADGARPDQSAPFPRAHTMEFENEVKDGGCLWRDLSQDDPRAEPSSTAHGQQVSKVCTSSVVLWLSNAPS